MKKILYSLSLATCLFAEIKDIPFGIKDTCSPIIREDSFSACYEENSFKWLSYSLSYDNSNKNSFNLDANFIENNSSEFTKLKEYQLKAISLLPISVKHQKTNINKTNMTFLIGNTNFEQFQKLKKQINDEVLKSNVKNINIIEGVVLDNNSKLNVGKNNYRLSNYYYLIVTDIDNKKIIISYLLDMSRGNYSIKNINDIRNLTKINFLYKIKE